MTLLDRNIAVQGYAAAELSAFQGRRSARIRDFLAILVLWLGAVGLPVFVAWRTGSLGIPHNDDWAYRRASVTFFETGSFHLVGWGAMTFVGQALFVWPFYELFGVHPWVPAASVAVVALIGITAWYALGRQFLGRSAAFVSTGLIAVTPGFSLNTATFMTDIPVWAVIGLCLLLGVLAAKSDGVRRWCLFGLAMATGCFGFSIREFAVAAPLAVLAGMLRVDRRRYGAYGAVGAVVVGACGALFLWTNRLPGQSHNPIAVPTLGTLLGLAQLYFTLALFLAPVVAWVTVKEWINRRAIGQAVFRVSRIGALVGLCLAVAPLAISQSVWTAAGVPPVWFVGNLLDQWGATGQNVLAGVRPEVVPVEFWALANCIAILSGILLLSLAVPRLRKVGGKIRSRSNMAAPVAVEFVIIFIALFGVLLIAYQLGYGESFDRYLWPLVAPVGALLLWRSSSSRPISKPRPVGASRTVVGAVAALCCVVVLSLTVTVTTNAFAFDGARWKAGELASKLGYSPQVVDAGFEWVGDHAVVPASKVTGVTSGHLLWTRGYEWLFPGATYCAVVAASRLVQPDAVLLRTLQYRTYWLAGRGRLYIYGIRSSSCSPLPMR